MIRLPIPDRKLHPNARTHYRDAAKVKREHRDNACSITMCMCPDKPNWNQVVVRPILIFKDKRHRDIDGMISSLKSYIDGVCDGGLIDDDRYLQWLPPLSSVDKNDAHLELHFYHGRLKELPDKELIEPAEERE